MMEYKGYRASTVVDAEAGIIHGEVVNTRDVITFQGETVAETLQAFHDSIDDYLDFCAERGEEPEQPKSGNFNVRIDPGLHASLAALSKETNTSINRLVESAVEVLVVEGPFGLNKSYRPSGFKVVSPEPQHEHQQAVKAARHAVGRVVEVAPRSAVYVTTKTGRSASTPKSGNFATKKDGRQPVTSKQAGKSGTVKKR